MKAIIYSSVKKKKTKCKTVIIKYVAAPLYIFAHLQGKHRLTNRATCGEPR